MIQNYKDLQNILAKILYNNVDLNLFNEKLDIIKDKCEGDNDLMYYLENIQESKENEIKNKLLQMIYYIDDVLHHFN